MGHPARLRRAHDCADPVERRDGYERRRPEETALYELIAEHWPEFREQVEAAGSGLPTFVVDEVEKYLTCGRLEHGCLSLVCRDCGHSQLVAFSCKGRAFCPSCVGRRMSDTAVHLVESVLPAVRVRHWICTLPWGLRALLGYDRKLCAAVVGAFAGEVSRSLAWRAKRELGLRSVEDAHTGSVFAVQRTDSALRLNVHFHGIALDGVYVRTGEGDDAPLVFHELAPPTRADVEAVARRTAARIETILGRHGRSLDPELCDDAPPALVSDDPGLAACYAAAAQGVGIDGDRAGWPTLRLLISPDTTARASDDDDAPVAEVRGVNVHAKQTVHGNDRRALERLARYIMRPPLSKERLTRRDDGRYELELKSPWRDGTRAFVFEPHELLARLVASVPPPRFHMLRYFGVLSSHSRLRREVVPQPPPDPTRLAPPPAAGDQLALAFDAEDQKLPPRCRWGWLLKHVFRADLATCPKCGGAMRWLEAATEPDDAARLMAEHGLGLQPPPAVRRAPSVPGQLRLPFG